MSITKEGQTATSATIPIGGHERATGGYLRYDVLPALFKETQEKFTEAMGVLNDTIRAFEGLEYKAGLTQGLKTLILALGQDNTGGHEITEDVIAMLHEATETLTTLRSKLGKVYHGGEPWATK